MINLSKRISAGLLALLILFCLIPLRGEAAGKITTTPTGYTSAADVNYVKDGKYVANWGARGEACVFLSSYAQSFYTGSNTFEALSALTGGSNQNNAPQSALYAALKSFMSGKHTYETSYDATKDLYKYTDCVLGDYSKLSSFYSGTMVNSAWSTGGKTWNREHTWPNSKGLGGNDENDIMMLRPTVPTENGSRRNKAYGLGSGCFDPGESVRGDCARIFLYVYTRWGNTSGNGQYTAWGSSGVIESLPLLLNWMKEDPVDTWEMGRNDAVQSITGTRNVFVDYPEFAWLLFGQDVPDNIVTPSGNDGATANPGGNSSGNTTDNSYTQISSLKDGDKVVIVNPASEMALSSTKTGFYNIGVNVSAGFAVISENEIFTAKKNSDGSWSFTSGDGKKLAMAEEYSSLNETGINDKWTLSSAGNNQFYLLNAGRDLYLEWYASKNNWSAYKPDTLNADYALAFYTKTSTGGSGSNSDSNSNNNSGNTNTGTGSTTTTTPPTTQPPATQPPATQPPVDTTTPPASEPDATEGTQASTPATSPDEPAPLPTTSVNPDDFIPHKKNSDSSAGKVIIIIAAIIFVALVAGGACVYFFVIKPKNTAAQAISEEAPPVEITEETPAEEVTEETNE